MKSMTGFGSAIASNTSGTGFKIEISSVNRKQFEIKFAIPREIGLYEGRLRQIISNGISRGSITLRIDIRNSGSERNDAALETNTLSINQTAVKNLVAQARKLAAETGLSSTFTLADILAIPGVVEASAIDYDTPETEKLLNDTMLAALDAFNAMRRCEGKNLAADIIKRLDIIKKSLEQIIPFTKDYPKKQYAKLVARLKEFELNASPDDERIMRELVIFADKADVTEEITRLYSHFGQFEKLMTVSGEPVGRQLDFLTQEIFREINTLGNKAASVEVSPHIVTMKTELEKIREQIQNIE